MRHFRTLIEARIQDAERRGDFRGLAHAGQPLPRDPLDDLPAEQRFEGMLTRTGGHIPEEVRLLKSIETWTDRLAHAETDAEARELRSRIREARLRLSVLFEMGGRRHMVAAMARGER